MQRRLIKIVNRQLNRNTIRNKVFCIGLHKTGTSTLSRWIAGYGFHSTHSIDWQTNPQKLEAYDFFSDGGSHFDNQHEFDFPGLLYRYPRAKFILQTRNTKSWLVSKLKHAGWHSATEIQPDNPEKIIHDDWMYKSFLTIEKFLEHKINYEKKVLAFFATHASNNLLVVDITQKTEQEVTLKRLREFLGLRSINFITFPHVNKAKTKDVLHADIMAFVEQKIKVYCEGRE